MVVPLAPVAPLPWWWWCLDFLPEVLSVVPEVLSVEPAAPELFVSDWEPLEVLPDADLCRWCRPVWLPDWVSDEPLCIV